MGLILQGDPPCVCLGVASEWLSDPRMTSVVARTILAGMWIVGLFLVTTGWKAFVRDAAGESKIRLAIPILLCILPGSVASLNGAVRVEGEYTQVFSRPARKGTGDEITKRDFVAHFDRDSLKISSSYDGLVGRHYTGRCTNIVFITKENFVSTLRCEGSEGENVVFSRTEYPWVLGNCGVGVENCIFLCIRCVDFFGSNGGVRQIAPPWTVGGEPLALINDAVYQYSNDSRGVQLAGKIIISGALREKWLSSELLSPGSVMAFKLQNIERELSAYKAGFLHGEFRFENFTNVTGLRFPMVAEFRRYKVSTADAGNRAGAHETILTDRQNLVLKKIEEVNEDISVLPIKGARVFVQDQRLFSHHHQIVEAHYETNVVDSFEISSHARGAFEKEVQKARERERALRIKQICTVLLMVALVLVYRFCVR